MGGRAIIRKLCTRYSMASGVPNGVCREEDLESEDAENVEKALGAVGVGIPGQVRHLRALHDAGIQMTECRRSNG